MAERFPVEDFRLHQSRWDLGGVQIGAGQSISGLTQTAKTDGGGYWVAELSFRLGPDQIKQWRAYGMRFDGGVGVLEVPFKQVDSKIVFDGEPDIAEVTFSDGATFSDGGLFVVDPTVTATFGASAALRATQVQLNFNSAVIVEGGEVFTVEHPNAGDCLYTVRSVVSQSGNNYTITIRPPLREAVTSATPLDFDDPRCTMRLATPDAWQPSLELLKRGHPSVVFVEHIEPQAAS